MPQIIVSQEVQRVLKAISDPEWVAGPFGGTGEEQVLRVVTEAQALWELTKPFCSSLQVAARWGGHPTGWRRGPTGSGPSSRPPARSRAASSRYWRFGICREWSRGWLLPRERGRPQVDNLKVLLVDSTIRDRYESKPFALLEATDPYKPSTTRTGRPTRLPAPASRESRSLRPWRI